MEPTSVALPFLPSRVRYSVGVLSGVFKAWRLAFRWRYLVIVGGAYGVMRHAPSEEFVEPDYEI